MGYEALKRLFDIIMAIFLLLLLFPLLIILALLVLLCMGRPVLHKHTRPGRDATPFELLKFRTMTEKKDEFGNYLSDRERLTSFGRFLRRFSLDELPQLLNVLRGDMSFVGPRPLLMEYLDRYNPEQARRHDVLPGITGWAQVNGRNALTWEQKFACDSWYVDNRSLFLDLKIMFMTLKKVVTGEGISQAGHVTAEPFRGNDTK